MTAREAAGWGLVGALSFIVLALGFQLATKAAIDLPVLGGVALAVGVVAGLASRGLGHRMD